MEERICMSTYGRINRDGWYMEVQIDTDWWITAGYYDCEKLMDSMEIEIPEEEYYENGVVVYVKALSYEIDESEWNWQHDALSGYVIDILEGEGLDVDEGYIRDCQGDCADPYIRFRLEH